MTHLTETRTGIIGFVAFFIIYNVIINYWFFYRESGNILYAPGSLLISFAGYLLGSYAYRKIKKDR